MKSRKKINPKSGIHLPLTSKVGSEGRILPESVKLTKEQPGESGLDTAIDAGTGSGDANLFMSQKKQKPPKPSSSDYPELLTVKKVKCDHGDEQRSCDDCLLASEASDTKKTDFGATIKRVQGSLDRINAMDKIQKAKLSAIIKPRYGQGLTDPVAEIGERKDYPKVSEESVNDMSGHQENSKESMQDEIKGDYPIGLEIEEVDPGLAMAKAWSDSVEDIRKGLDAWTPEFGKSLAKARVDEGLSPQRKASARAKRNDRMYSLNDKKAPKSTLSRDSKFYNAKTPGALAGRKGEKIYGKPKTTGGGGMGENHPSSYSRHDLRGRSSAGINAEWAGKHTHPGHAAYARQKAVTLHQQKVAQIKAAPKGYQMTAKGEDAFEKALPKGYPVGSDKHPDQIIHASRTNRAGLSGQSKLGHHIREKEIGLAREQAQRNVAQQKQMPKPALKIEKGAKAPKALDEGYKGVHKPVGHEGQSVMGMTIPSKMAGPQHRAKQYAQAKQQAKQVIREIRSIKPNLKSEDQSDMSKYEFTAKGEEILKAYDQRYNQRGVLGAVSSRKPGVSVPGHDIRNVQHEPTRAGKQNRIAEAKMTHRQLSRQIKQMVGQDRSGMGKAEGGYEFTAKGEALIEKKEPTPWKGPHSSSTGVNAPLPTRETAGWKGNSQSEAGVRLRTGNKYGPDMKSSKTVAYSDAKQLHRETISELRSMKKPNLP